MRSPDIVRRSSNRGYSRFTNIPISRNIVRARAQIGRCVELGLVCDLTADLQKLRVKPETLESDLAKLLTRQYFFSIPADAAQLSARVIALLSAKRIYEENGR